MMSTLAGVALYMSFKTIVTTIDNPDWSVRRQFTTSVRYIVYSTIFFIGPNLIVLLLTELGAYVM